MWAAIHYVSPSLPKPLKALFFLLETEEQGFFICCKQG
jgi:hypothetical protein